MAHADGAARTTAPAGEAEIYTLRVWRQPDGFRAALRAVGAEESSFFTEAGSLVEFLARPAAARTPALPAPPPAAPCRRD